MIKSMKRFACLLLTLFLFIGLMPVPNVMAAEVSAPELGEVIISEEPTYLTSERTRAIVDVAQNKVSIHVGTTWYGLFWKNGNTWQQWGGDDWWINSISYYPFESGKVGYCIEPYNTTLGIGENKYPTSWDAIPVKWKDSGKFEDEKREGIALVMIYGAPNNGDTTEAGYYATSALIWDMTCGYRNTNGTLRFSNKQSPFYNALKSALQNNNTTLWNQIDSKYNEILNCLAKHGTIPSFTVRYASQIKDAQTITLNYDAASGLYKASVTDTNGVLKSFNYQSNISGLTFTKDGNTLHITATPEAAAQLSTTAATCRSRGNEVEVGPDSVILWGNSSSTAQVMVTMDAAADPVPSYFRLKAAAFGSLEITKTSEDHKVAGIGFTLTDSTGAVKNGTTDANGKLTFTDLTPGTYTVTENTSSIYAPQSAQTVAVVSNQTTKVTFSNKLQRGAVAVAKSSEDGNVSGKQFRLYGTSRSGQAVDLYATTDAAGNTVFNNVLIGTYTLEEINIPSYYIPPAAQTVTVEYDTTSKATFHNTLKRGSLSVTKQSEDNKISGLQFRLSGTSTSGQSVDLYATTDAEGKATFANVLIGTYTLQEANVPDKYVVPDNQTVSITWNDTTEAPVSNVLKKWMATVTKTDKETGTAQGDATLEGAVYGIYDGTTLVDSYVTDANGQFTTKYYTCGDNWTIREIQPSEGYLLDTTAYHIGAEAELYTVELNSTVNAVTEQVSKGRIAIIKHTDDGSTQIETPEVGAEFVVYLKSAGSYDAAKETERDHLICDENGFAETKHLPYGIYTVQQTESWEGLELLPAFDVYVTRDGEIYRFLINNASFDSYIRIVKTDAETGKTIPYAGSGFQIYDPSGQLITMNITYPTPMTIDTFYTDGNGCLVTPEKLPYGKGYSIVEVQAPQGYVLDSTPVYFNVDKVHSSNAGKINVIEVVRANVPQKGTITISKTGEVFSTVALTDGLYQPVYALQGLPGATYEITAAEDIYTLDGTLRASKGQVIDTVTTGTGGTATSKLLYLGKYKIKEIIAPHGMVLSSDIYSAELVYAGQDVQLTSTITSVTNERQKVSVSLIKELEQDELFDIGCNGEILAVKFGLYAAEDLTAADGSVIPADGLLEIAVCDENGKLTFATDIPIDAKLYVKEVATNKHYIIADTKYPVTFSYAGQEVETVNISVNDDVVIENEIIRGDIIGKKLDEDGFAICGALFGLFREDEKTFDETTALKTCTSNEIGVFLFEDVPYGRWIVREIHATPAFVLNENSYAVTIRQDEEVAEVVIENDFIVGSAQTVKVDAEDPTKKLTGAVFEIYVDVDRNKAFNEEIDLLVGEMSEKQSGIYGMNDLRYGGYFLHEKTAPEGYLHDIGYYYFAILEDGEVITVENRAGVGFANPPITGELVITKTDSDSGKPLDGVPFCVKDAAGNVVAEGLTDKDGIVKFTLRYGKYTYEEIAPLEGYLANSEVRTIEIQENGQVIQETVTNARIPVTPETGDTANIGLSLLCCLIAMTGIAVIILLKRSKKEN